MKILVLSDSHSSLRFMFRAAEVLKPDAIVHLGDYFEDGMALHQEYPGTPMYQVPGNCDYYRLAPGQAWIRVEQVCGVNLYMTHGHKHDVKTSLYSLLRDARACKVDAVLYGHTHQPDCRQEDGLWILNPGSAGYGGCTAGVIEVTDGNIDAVYLIRESDLILFLDKMV